MAYGASAALPRIVTSVEKIGHWISGVEVGTQPERRAS